MSAVRRGRLEDVPAVALAVEALLVELGGARPPQPALEAEVAALVADEGVGALLVAEDGGEPVGVLAASYCRAIHVPGRYATIQDLWVDPEWRSRGVGAELVAALAALARDEGLARIEVGLPREGWPGLDRTAAFYAGTGFEPLGPRMRLQLGVDGPISGHIDTKSAHRPLGSRA